jgi:tryptophanyl-tRNA synthetase
MTSLKKIFSGIQPTGIVHIGNYLGALKNWVALQDQHQCTYCVVDLHAITVEQDPAELKRSILYTSAVCLALGVDPTRSILFVQSDAPEHSELAWILNCHAYMGELRRMTQYKDKAAKGEESSTVGLFDYPVLMAADILVHRAQAVPVGEDQKQHLELARDLARRFNNKYGETFPVPEPIIPKEGARIMGLDDPTRKMSKSASSTANFVALNDSPDLIRKKLKTAVTDSGKEVLFDEEKKPGISNLLTLLSLTTGRTVPSLEAEYAGQGYGKFKGDVADALVAFLAPLREAIDRRLAEPAEVEAILKAGSVQARESASATLKHVKETLGLSSQDLKAPTKSLTQKLDELNKA